MSWFRVHQATDSLLHRSKRRILIVAGARSAASREESSSIDPSGERRYLGLRRAGDPSSRLKSITCFPKFLPVYSNWRLIMTRAFINENEVMKALELFLSTVDDMSISKDQICGLYIESLCRSGNLLGAVHLLSYLRGREINPSLDTYNTLLSAANEARKFDLFSEIFKSLLFSNKAPDFISYVNVANAFEKLSDSNQLLKFILEVSGITVHRAPTVMNRIIFIIAKSGQIDKSMLIYEELKNLNLKMDIVTFNTILAMLGRAGRVDEMLSVFSTMKDCGHLPDIVTYNTLINCLRRLGKLDLCKGIAKEMFERGIAMDLRTYTALIDAFGRAGHVEHALRIFNEMKKSQCPSIYVYRALINDLKKAGKYELALNLLEEMNLSTTKLIGPADFKKKGRRNAS